MSPPFLKIILKYNKQIICRNYLLKNSEGLTARTAQNNRTARTNRTTRTSWTTRTAQTTQTTRTALISLRGPRNPSSPSSPIIINKKNPSKDCSLEGLYNSFVSMKKGGYLLSRIALQYHRRKQA